MVKILTILRYIIYNVSITNYKVQCNVRDHCGTVYFLVQVVQIIAVL